MSKHRSAVSVRGQVVIPKPLRDRLGLRPGTQLEFFEEHGRLVAVKAQTHNPVAAVYGTLALGRPTDELVAALRGPAEKKK